MMIICLVEVRVLLFSVVIAALTMDGLFYYNLYSKLLLVLYWEAGACLDTIALCPVQTNRADVWYFNKLKMNKNVAKLYSSRIPFSQCVCYYPVSNTATSAFQCFNHIQCKV